MRFPSLLIYLPVYTLLLPAPAQAAEWWVKPDINLKSGYNDNINLTTVPHDSVWETDLSTTATFGVARENQGVNGFGAINIRRFTGGSGLEGSELLDREDYIFRADAYHQSELNSFRGNIGYTQDSTLDSQLNESGLVSRTRATREKSTLGASWARTLTEKLQFNLGYQYTNVKYPDALRIDRLVPYDFDVFSASLGYQYTQRTQFTLATSRSNFKPTTGFNSNTLNIQAGITHSFSETISMSLLAGQRETTSDSLFATGFCIGANPGASFPECTGGVPIVTGRDKGETVSSGPTYNIRITKDFETGVLGATLTRSTSPGLNGELLDRNSIVIFSEHRFSDRLRSSLRFQYSQNETIVNAIGRESVKDTRKFFRVTPRLSWQWLREWTIVGEYQYARNQDRLLRTGTQNAVYLTLSYRPTRLSISR